MNRLWMAAALAAALALPLLGNGSASAQTQTQSAPATAAADLQLGIDDNYHFHIVAPGSTISLSLPENMSTGLSWKIQNVDEDGVSIAGERHDQATSVPGGNGSFSVQLKVGTSGKARLTLVKARGYEKPAEEFMIFLKVGPVPATTQEAARAFAVDEMRLQCDLNKEFGGQIDHVFMEGEFALSTWTCGHMHGEYAFQMHGLARGSKSKATVADVGYDARIDVEGLLWLGMDRDSSFNLLKQRRAAQ